MKNPLTVLSNGWKRMLSAVTNWRSSRKSKRDLSLAKRTTFNIEFKTLINHIIIFENQVYRMVIDESSINIIDIRGGVIQDENLIVKLLQEVKRNGS
ncbi:hypothetical protein [Aeromonas caviae]